MTFLELQMNASDKIMINEWNWNQTTTVCSFDLVSFGL